MESAAHCHGPATVVFDESLTSYNFGDGHPMSPVRVDLTMRLARELGVLGDRLRTVPAPVASDELIATVHDASLIEAVTKAGSTPGYEDPRHGLGSDDNPVFKDMHLAAAHVVGASVEAFRQVYSGESLHSANISGGLHHGMPARASGFCVYNDIAVGIQRLLERGAKRVVYLDLDVHHGDGVERCFWNDDRVLTVSLHETGRALFPGTGFPQDVGGPRAEGPRSTWRCRPAPVTPAGCARSTRSCRRCCASSSRRCWSPSTGATRTWRTRSRT